jgi:hypothetical protein
LTLFDGNGKPTINPFGRNPLKKVEENMSERFSSIKKRVCFLTALLSVLFGFSGLAQAGVFNIPHYVEPGRFAVGIEPEVMLDPESSVGINFKYTHGLSELINVQGVIGTGTGSRQFRTGGSLIFDFFPDLENQPGMGVASQNLYYRLEEHGVFEFTLIPYIHKSFIYENNEFEPFISFPFGLLFEDGSYSSTAWLAVGSLFKVMEHYRVTIELGVNVSRAWTYFSGGMTYYY